MKVIRLVFHQNNANFAKEGSIDNKMTYPLPPVSTVIGAIHNACGYKTYHSMDVSIQGRYDTLYQRPYTHHCFLDSTMDDRGILVKMYNKDMLGTAYNEVAVALKKQGNSFRKGITIGVKNKELLEEYRKLKETGDFIDRYKKKYIDPELNLLNSKKKELNKQRKESEKGSLEFETAKQEIEKINEKIKNIKSRFDDYQKRKYKDPISYFRILVKSLKRYEILSDMELIIHIRSDEETMKDIMEHCYDIISIGRSEDYVYLEDAAFVELAEECEGDEVISDYSAYVDCELVKNDQVFPHTRKGRISGTVYYLNKDYQIVDRKRVFNKKKVLYLSQHAVEEFGNGLYVDKYNGKELIVNLL